MRAKIIYKPITFQLNERNSQSIVVGIAVPSPYNGVRLISEAEQGLLENQATVGDVGRFKRTMAHLRKLNEEDILMTSTHYEHSFRVNGNESGIILDTENEETGECLTSDEVIDIVWEDEIGYRFVE